MIKLNDGWFRAGSLLLCMLVSVYLNKWYVNPLQWTHIAGMASCLVILLLALEGNRFIIKYSRTLFSGRFANIQRVLLIIPVGIAFTTGVILLNDITDNFITTGEWKFVLLSDSHLYVNNQEITVGVLGSSIFKAVLVFLPLWLIHGMFYHFAAIRSIEQERDKLEKEKLKAEVHRLKEVLNPHFLFNSLNSLSFLISDNAPQAEKFLDELTKVYRYLLRNNDAELTTLSSELQFIQSYFHLLKTRYGEGLLVDIDVQEQQLDYLLPPLTLQLLVENAVKHNRLDKEQPLKISIRSCENLQLCISNNIQKKDRQVESTRIGLQNIQAKYQLLNHSGVVIQQDSHQFLVNVLLIENYKNA